MNETFRSVLIYVGIFIVSIPVLFIIYFTSAMAIGTTPSTSWSLKKLFMLAIFILGITTPIILGFLINWFISKDFKSSIRLFVIVLVVYHIALGIFVY